MAYKVFQNGFPLNASELNNYLMNQSVMVFASTTARDADLTAPLEGMIVWLQDSNKFVYYTGTAWADVIQPDSSGNAIINGAFDIWQRGTSFTNFNGTFSADRWRMDVGGGIPTGTISQQTFTPGTAPVAGYESAYYLRVNYTALNSATVIELSNKIEDVRTFAGQTVTLSFWAKADTARSMTAFIRQGFGTGGSTSVDATGTTVSLTTSWQRFTQTVTLASIAGKTIGTGSSLDVRMDLPLTAGSTVDIWGVQLESGSTATTFKRNASNIQGELAACQRYYERITAAGSDLPITGTAIATSSSAVIISIPYKVKKRIAPSSVDFAFPKVSNAYSVASNMTNVALSGANEDSTNLSITGGSGLTAGNLYLFYGQSGQTGYVGFNSEL